MAYSGISIVQDAGLRSLAYSALSQWRRGVQITVSFLMLGAFTYLFLVPFSLKSTLLINDAQTSQLQAFTNNFFALSKMQSSGRKGQSPASASIEFLERQDTFANFLRYLTERSRAADLSEEARIGMADVSSYLGEDLQKGDFNYRKAALDIKELVKLSAKSATEISIVASGRSKELTFLLNMEYSKFAAEALKQQEEKKMEQVKLAIEKQRDHFKAQFEDKNKELIAFQSRPENVLSLASGASVGNYISELVVRKNEIDLKVEENERAIQYLGGAKAADLAASRNLGQRSQAQLLIEETKLLRKQGSAIQESIKKFTSATNGTAEAMRMHEELKKTTDREFKNFQEANDLLSKMEVYSVSVAGKFELLQAPEIDEVKKASSLYLVFALSLFLSQLVFAGYLYALFAFPAPNQIGRLREVFLRGGRQALRFPGTVPVERAK